MWLLLTLDVELQEFRLDALLDALREFGVTVEELKVKRVGRESTVVTLEGEPSLILELAARLKRESPARTRFFERARVREVSVQEPRRRTALLIGASGRGLKGTRNDVLRLEPLLRARGFTTLRCLPDQPDQAQGYPATRAGILSALHELVERAKEHEAIVIYYSGHGALLRRRAHAIEPGADPRDPHCYAFLVPTDIFDGSADDFRGILLAELDVALQRLSAAGVNLTVILDCCYATSILRGGRDDEHEVRAGIRTQSLGAAVLAGAASHFARLRAEGLDPELRAHACHPDVVRLLASGPAEEAGEVTDRGRAHGLMTAALCSILERLGDQTTTWQNVARELRNAVLSRRSSQTPILKGPAGRLLFSDEIQVSRRGVGVGCSNLHPEYVLFLELGALAGVRRGDIYNLFAPAPATAATRSQRAVTTMFARARVVQVYAAHATIKLLPSPTGAPPPTGDDPRLSTASAYLSRYSRPVGQIRLITRTDAGARLLPQALPASGAFTRACAPDDDIALALVEQDGRIELQTPDGRLLRDAVSFRLDDADACERALDYLRRTLEFLARARALSRLRSGVGEGALTRGVSCSITYVSPRVREGTTEAVTEAEGAIEGATASPPRRLAADESLIVDLAITDRFSGQLRGWVFFIKPDGVIELLSRQFPTGAPFNRGAPFSCGRSVHNERVGVSIRPAKFTPRVGGNTSGRLVVIVADGRADLSSLASGRVPRLHEDPLADELVYRRDQPAPKHLDARRYRVFHRDVEMTDADR